MRVLHTADWHLGHHLHDVPREKEHDKFLRWLADLMVEKEVDALLVAGDVFDTVNPPAAANRMWFSFLAEVSGSLPNLTVVVIAGNHDSPRRLESASPILENLKVHVIGSTHAQIGQSDSDRLIIPLRDRDNEVRALVAAVPFLRISDLPRCDSPDQNLDPFIEGVRQVYAQVIEATLLKRTSKDQAIIAMGHCYMRGTSLSENSERKILIGNQHALPHDLFSNEVAYVALGHLHRAQRVGEDRIRYSGSPIPLSMNERDYEHRVLLVDLEGQGLKVVEEVAVPRSVRFERVPEKDSLPLEEVLTLLRELETLPADEPAPFLEVAVRIDKPQPTLRAEIDKALERKGRHLTRIKPTYTGTTGAEANRTVLQNLNQLDPESLLRELWTRRHQESELTREVLDLFSELVEAAQQGVTE